MTAARSDLMALAADSLEQASQTLSIMSSGYFAEAQTELSTALATDAGRCFDLVNSAIENIRLAASQPDREAVREAILNELFRASDHAVLAHNTVHELKPYIERAILSLLSGAGTKSDGGKRVNLSGTDLMPMDEVRQLDPSPGPDVREAITNRIDRILEQTDRLFELDTDTSDARALNDRAVRDLRDILSAFTRPLGGVVQGSIGTKQSTDPEGSSRTETAGCDPSTEERG